MAFVRDAPIRRASRASFTRQSTAPGISAKNLGLSLNYQKRISSFFGFRLPQLPSSSGAALELDLLRPGELPWVIRFIANMELLSKRNSLCPIWVIARILFPDYRESTEEKRKSRACLIFADYTDLLLYGVGKSSRRMARENDLQVDCNTSGTRAGEGKLCGVDSL